MSPDIPDGYTEEHSIDGVAILLRPFTRWDRRALGEYLLGMTDVMLHRAERRLVLSRVVDCDGDIEDLDSVRLWELAMGIHNTEREIADETNLSDGVFIAIRYPWLARTTCDQCRKFLWNPLTGVLHRNAGGPPLEREGDPPCEPAAASPCPKGHWGNPVQLSAKNQKAWRFHQACEASGVFPDDPIVRRNERVIRDVFRRAEQNPAADAGAGGRSRPAGEPRHARVGRAIRSHRAIQRVQ